MRDETNRGGGSLAIHKKKPLQRANTQTHELKIIPTWKEARINANTTIHTIVHQTLFAYEDEKMFSVKKV